MCVLQGTVACHVRTIQLLSQTHAWMRRVCWWTRRCHLRTALTTRCHSLRQWARTRRYATSIAPLFSQTKVLRKFTVYSLRIPEVAWSPCSSCCPPRPFLSTDLCQSLQFSHVTFHLSVSVICILCTLIDEKSPFPFPPQSFLLNSAFVMFSGIWLSYLIWVFP